MLGPYNSKAAAMTYYVVGAPPEDDFRPNYTRVGPTSWLYIPVPTSLDPLSAAAHEHRISGLIEFLVDCIDASTTRDIDAIGRSYLETLHRLITGQRTVFQLAQTVLNTVMAHFRVLDWRVLLEVRHYANR